VKLPNRSLTESELASVAEIHRLAGIALVQRGRLDKVTSNNIAVKTYADSLQKATTLTSQPARNKFEPHDPTGGLRKALEKD
jgi:hypothetical protein